MKLQRLWLLLPLVVILSGVGPIFAEITPEDFVNPPSNFTPMNIYLYKFNYMGMIPQNGDKVGAFDGDLCVGVWELDQDFDEYTVLPERNVRAYKEYKENGVVVDEGFVEGHPIKLYLLRDQTVVSIPDTNMIFYRTDQVDENGDFIPLEDPVPYAGQGTAMIEVHSGLTKLTISADPDTAGNTIPKADEYIYSAIDSVEQEIQIDSASVKEHFEFSHWTVDGLTNDNERVTVEMSENHTVVANFVKKEYTLTAVAQPSVGEVIPASPQQVEAETWADIFAKPTDGSGYQFSHWTSDPKGVVEDSTQASTRAWMLQDTQVTAVFTVEQDTLMITVSPEGAGVTVPAAGEVHVYDYEDEVALSETANNGYVFSHWAEHVTTPKDSMIELSTESSINITMMGNRDIYAVYDKQMFTLSLNVDELMGSIYIRRPLDDDSSKAESEYSFAYETPITLYAISNDIVLYPFLDWSGDVSSTENEITVTIDSTMTITANFENTVPVELSSFTVQEAPKSVNNALMLKWQTASETNNLGFDIECSVGDDSHWKKIGFLKGYGTTSDAKFYEFIDDEATTEGSFFYRLKQIDTNGAFEYSSVVKFDVTAPNEFALKQNYPNPFNPSTNIVFQLKEDIDVTLSVYDLLGRNVVTLVDEPMKAGSHKITLDATEFSAGVYFYSLKAGSFSEMKKMTLLK